MKRTLTTVRCVPRFGYEYADVRTVDIDGATQSEEEMLYALRRWFAMRGIADAVYGVDADDDGLFAIVNDEAYQGEWGTPLL